MCFQRLLNYLVFQFFLSWAYPDEDSRWGNFQLVIRKTWPWTTLGSMFGEWLAPCTLKTYFVDFRNEHALCSRYKRIKFSFLSNFSYLFCGNNQSINQSINQPINQSINQKDALLFRRIIIITMYFLKMHLYL